MCGMNRARRIRLAVAGVLMLIGGLGFGISIISGTVYFVVYGVAYGPPGFETYGTGPLGKLGTLTTAFAIGFAVVCVAQVVCGILLILGRRIAFVPALVLVPLSVLFCIGFDLPFAYPGALATAVLLLWPSRADAPAD
jgi:hypothetical protein